MSIFERIMAGEVNKRMCWFLEWMCIDGFLF